MELRIESIGAIMSEYTKKGSGLMKQWKQAIGRFIAFCLNGNQDPMKVVESRQIRADLSRQIKAEEELLRKRSEKW